MSDRVVVMDKAVIQQIGDPQNIYADPVNTFVAKFIGSTTILEGTSLGRTGEYCDMEVPLGEGIAPLKLQATGGAGATSGQPLYLSLRPEDITLHLEKPSGTSHGNVFEGNIIDTIYLGSFLECRIDVGGHEVGIQIDHFEQLDSGQKVFLSFQPDHGLCLTE
jgi:putrescine transport system ATP-binding protein